MMAIRQRRWMQLGALWLGLLWVHSTAAALTPVRRLFEPTDLELEDPGVAELDLQFGLVRGQNAHRIVVPDTEIDLGLTKNIELDLDGQFAVSGPDSGDFVFDRIAPDNLWPSLKLGLLDFADEAENIAWAFGMQLGPKLPLAQGARGVGFEGLLLLGCRNHHTYLILNLGGRRDPSYGGNRSGPSGPEMGLDVDHPLDATEHWALIAAIGAVTYVSPDPNQLTTTAGIAYRPSESLEFSVVALYGWLSGGDQYGILFGISPKFQLW